MRILHAPTNIAGQPYVVSRALRRLGHTSDVAVTERHAFGYPEDIVFDHDRLPTPWRQIRKATALASLIRNYDVFHFYAGNSLLAGFRDVDLIRRAGRRVIMHFRGSEIRMCGRERAGRKFSACSDCATQCTPDAGKVALRERAWEIADRVLVATPDLLEWVPGAQMITQAIDLDDWPEIPPPPPEKEHYVVLHAPSNPVIKGTRYLEQAVANLQAKGYPVELRLMQRRPHAEVRRAVQEADIVVDQLLMGWYANFAIEAMVSGRPVIAYVRDDLKTLTGFDPPILDANPETIEERLGTLVADARLRAELGAAGRAYVERIHGAGRIAEQLVACYESCR